jgi:ABC-2 type transport system permease protein
MKNFFNAKQFVAYRSLGYSLIVRLSRLALLLSSSLLNIAFELFMYTTVLGKVQINYAISGIILGLVAGEMMSETSFNLYYSKFKGHLYSILASPVDDHIILLSYISSGILRTTIMLTIAMILIQFTIGFKIAIIYPLQFIILMFLIAIFFSMIGLVEGIYAESFMQSGFASRFIFSFLSTFSGSLAPIPQSRAIVTKFLPYNPVYYMNNMIRYYISGESKFIPNNMLLLQIALVNVFLFAIVMQCFKSLRK